MTEWLFLGSGLIGLALILLAFWMIGSFLNEFIGVFTKN